jgi:hypothetical protein
MENRFNSGWVREGEKAGTEERGGGRWEEVNMELRKGESLEPSSFETRGRAARDRENMCEFEHEKRTDKNEVFPRAMKEQKDK